MGTPRARAAGSKKEAVHPTKEEINPHTPGPQETPTRTRPIPHIGVLAAAPRNGFQIPGMIFFSPKNIPRATCWASSAIIQSLLL